MALVLTVEVLSGYYLYKFIFCAGLFLAIFNGVCLFGPSTKGSMPLLKKITIIPQQEFESSKAYKRFVAKFIGKPIGKEFQSVISYGINTFLFKEGLAQRVDVETELQILKEGLDSQVVICNVFIKSKLQLRFGKIFLSDKNSLDKINIVNYQEKLSGPDIEKMLCFKEGDAWSWTAVDQSIKNLQECPLFKSAKFKIHPELGSEMDCPVEIVLEQNFDKQYRLRIGGEVQQNSIDKYLMLDCDAFNYKIKNSIFNVGMDLRGSFTKFKAQYEIPTTIFMPINFVFFVHSQFDRPDKKMSMGIDGQMDLENYCQNCLAERVAENSILSSTKVGISVEPRIMVFGHKMFYNIIFDRKKFDLKDFGDRHFLQQFVFRRQNIENGWSNRIGESFCLKATLAASKNQVVSEFSLNQTVFMPLSTTSTICLLWDANFGTKSNFIKSFKQLCKNAASLIFPKGNGSFLEATFCDSCSDQKFKNMYPPVSDRIKHENCIDKSNVLYSDGLLHSDLMFQFRKKFSNAFSGLLFHTLFYSQGSGLYNSSGLGIRYNSAFGAFCLDFAFKWDDQESILKKLSWRFTFGESF